MRYISYSTKFITNHAILALFVVGLAIFLPLPVHAEVIDKIVFPWEGRLLFTAFIALVFVSSMAWFLPKSFRYTSMAMALSWLGFRLFLNEVYFDPEISTSLKKELLTAGLYEKYLAWMYGEAILPMILCLVILFMRNHSQRRSNS